MSGSARLRDSPRSGLIAAALCVLATAAVLITAPAVRILGRPPVRSASGTHSRRRSVQSLPTRRALITTPTGAHQG